MRLLLTILLTICYSLGYAQYVEGTVMSADDQELLDGVMVINKRMNISVISNIRGHYRIPATAGDTLIFMLTSFKSERIVTGGNASKMLVKLQRTTTKLEEVEVQSELARYEKEHAEMLKTYDKSFSDARKKVKLGLNNGLVINGIFSELASRISGQKKKDKRFLQDFEQSEEQKYISIRYNPDVVNRMTGLEGDSLRSFMYTYPMEGKFARYATDLEIKMWIRNNYKLWIHQLKEGTLTLDSIKVYK